jgi:Ser/Thr protein kinase RdoA (MazF antagonist)
VPGKDLPAGTYVFKLADSESNRDMVEVFTEDKQHLLATFIAVPQTRLAAANTTIVTFAERPIGTPEAVRSWFYPGDTDGLEFVYPR